MFDELELQRIVHALELKAELLDDEIEHTGNKELKEHKTLVLVGFLVILQKFKTVSALLAEQPAMTEVGLLKRELWRVIHNHDIRKNMDIISDLRGLLNNWPENPLTSSVIANIKSIDDLV